MNDLDKLVPMPLASFPNARGDLHTVEQMQALRADTAKAVAQRCVEICREAQYRPDIVKLIAAEFGLEVRDDRHNTHLARSLGAKK